MRLTLESNRISKKNRIAVIVVWAGILLLAVDVARVCAGEYPPTHDEILSRLLAQGVEEIIPSIRQAAGSCSDGLVIQREGDTEYDAMVEDLLVEHLLSSELVIYEKKDESGGNGSDTLAAAPSCALLFRIADSGISFPSYGRTLWVGKARVVRRFRILLHFRLVEQTSGEILWTSSKELAWEDEIALKNLLSMDESPGVDMPEPPKVSSPIETVILIILLFGMAYIFTAEAR